MQERKVHTLPGSAALLLSLGLLAAAVALPATQLTSHAVQSHPAQHTGLIVGCAVGAAVLGLAGFILLAGMFTVAPNEGRVLQLFGRYVGTAREEGWRWVNPFYAKRAISLR